MLYHQLTSPVQYLAIRSDNAAKRNVDFVLPALVSAAITVFVIAWPDVLPMRGSHGLVVGINGLLQMLVGFYVASLAAIATFPNEALKENALGMRLHGAPILRRRLVALLFGYLAFCALGTYIAGLFSAIPSAIEHSIAWPLARTAVRILVVFVYFFFLSQIVTITLMGIHYLVDRMHRPDVSKSNDDVTSRKVRAVR